MFEQELDFFIKNQDSLVDQYHGKALIIKGSEVLGVHDTPLRAYLEAEKNHQLGDVMIQICEPGVEAYTVTID